MWKWRYESSKLCRMCDKGRGVMVEHLLECLRYVSDEREMLSVVVRKTGVAGWDAMQRVGTDRVLEGPLGLSCRN